MDPGAAFGVITWPVGTIDRSPKLPTGSIVSPLLNCAIAKPGTSANRIKEWCFVKIASFKNRNMSDSFSQLFSNEREIRSAFQGAETCERVAPVAGLGHTIGLWAL